MAKNDNKKQLSIEEIEQQIAEITQTLSGPRIPSAERLMLNEDRRDLRKLLAQMNEAVK